MKTADALKNQEQLLKKDHQKQKKTKSKIYETIWKAILIFVSIVSAILLNKIYLYQTLDDFAQIRKGNITQLSLYGLLFAIVFIKIDTLFHKYLDSWFQLYYINHDKYKNEESRKRRCYKLVRWVFSLVYYTVSSICAYLIVKPTSFMPTWLGGNGYCTDLGRYVYSLDEANICMKIFYFIQFGKHLGRLIHHIFIRPQGNFYEYALHHGLSTFLIFFSYLMNMWLIGIFVLLIHDLSDIALILPRAYRDYKGLNKKMLIYLDVGGGLVWVFCRIFLLSYCCVYSSFSTAYEFWKREDIHDTQIYKVLFFPGVFMGFMLFALLILQVFWTYYAISTVVITTLSSTVKNTYE